MFVNFKQRYNIKKFKREITGHSRTLHVLLYYFAITAKQEECFSFSVKK